MTDEQAQAIFTELLRITRGFSEAVRQISEMKAEIVALQWIVEKKVVASAEELDALRDEALRRSNATDQPSTPRLEVLLDNEGEWKM
jgi:hypothetical protein